MPTTIEDAIQKAKMIEQGQKNASAALTGNHMVATLQHQNQILQQQIEQQKSQNYGQPQWKPKPTPNNTTTYNNNQRDGRNRGNGKGRNPNWN